MWPRRKLGDERWLWLMECLGTSMRSRRASGLRRSTRSSSTTDRVGPVTSSRESWSVPSAPARARSRPSIRRTSTRSPPSARRRCPVIRRSSAGFGRSCGGTPWRWWCAPTSTHPSSAATSRATSRWRRCTRSASTTSGTLPARATVATSCTSRVTPRPATMHGRFWRAVSPRSSSTAFARRCQSPAA